MLRNNTVKLHEELGKMNGRVQDEIGKIQNGLERNKNVWDNEKKHAARAKIKQLQDELGPTEEALKKKLAVRQKELMNVKYFSENLVYSKFTC